jgi:hypothetical protein
VRAGGLTLAALLTAVASFAQTAQTSAQPRPAPLALLKDVSFEGVTVFSPAEISWWLDLDDGEPMPRPADELAQMLERRYHREGYGHARVQASFEEAAGRLRLIADEGRIDAIEFEGIEPPLVDRLRGDFDVRAGDIYHGRHVGRAIERLLAPMRGAIHSAGHDLIDRGGRRVLVVELKRESARGQFDVGTDARQDWFNPVDGFSPAIGFRLTLFDQARFNHTYIRGFLTYKFAREEAGYSIGFERPILGGPDRARLFVGAEAHELTATDDDWRLSELEQSLVALAFRNSFRDYHERRGFAVHGALRFHPAQEIVASWRADRLAPLANATEYGLFRDDHAFRPNQMAAAGTLRALMLGYTLDTRGLEQETLGRTYERHLLTSPFGTRGGRGSGWRIEWTSELAPSGFGGDFDFSRHIVNARAYLPVAGPHDLRVRAIVGAATGTPPPQRQFAIGGIGSVHGYSFKEAVGERLALLNGEYRFGSHGFGGARLIAFVDAGRVWKPVAGSPADWLTGIGGGFEIGDFRVELGWRLDDIPKSFQALVRFGPSF